MSTIEFRSADQYQNIPVTPATPLPVSSIGTGTGGAQPVEGNAASGATDTGNPVKVGFVVQSTPAAAGVDGQRASQQGDGYGGSYVVLKSPTVGGLANYGQTSTDAVPVSGAFNTLRVVSFSAMYNGATWDRARGTTVGAAVVMKAEATGGALMAKIISAATTNPTTIKAAASSVVGIDVYNSGAAVCFLKLYNKASAPVVGTDIPSKVIAIPPGAPREINRPLAEAFTVGLSYAITTGFADSDTGAVAAGQVTGSIDYA